MSALFGDLKQGLEEAVAYEKGEGDGTAHTFVIEPVQEFSNKEIRDIRMAAGMTQRIFAYYMGVSQKTVEAWENGRNRPGGSACRLMQMIKENKASISKLNDQEEAGKDLSKSETMHQLYDECKNIEFDESYALIKNAQPEEEKHFIKAVTDYILQQKQKTVIAEKRF